MNSKMSDHIFHYASYTSHLYQCVDSTRDLVEVTRRGESSLHYNSPPVLPLESPSEQNVLGPQFVAGEAVSPNC